MSFLLRKINAVLTINEEIGVRILSAKGPVNNPYMLDSAQIVQGWRRGDHYHLADSVMDIFNDNLNDMIKKTKTFNDIKILNSKFTTILPKWEVLRSSVDVLSGLKNVLTIIEIIQCCFGELESELQSVPEDNRKEIDEQARLVNESLQKLSVVASKDRSQFIFTAPLMYNWEDSNIFNRMTFKQLSTIENILNKSIFPTKVPKTYQPTPILIYQASLDNFTTLIPKVIEFVGLKSNFLFSGHLLFIFQSVEDDGGGTVGFVIPYSDTIWGGTILGIDISTPNSDPYEVNINIRNRTGQDQLIQLLSNVISASDKPITPQNNNTSTFESFRYVSWTSGPPPNHGQRRLNTTTVISPAVRGRCINVTDAVVYAFVKEN
eukprot:gene1519-2919_t